MKLTAELGLIGTIADNLSRLSAFIRVYCYVCRQEVESITDTELQDSINMIPDQYYSPVMAEPNLKHSFSVDMEKKLYGCD